MLITKIFVTPGCDYLFIMIELQAERTVRREHAEKDSQNKRGRNGHVELDRQNLCRQNWTGRTGQAELDRQN
jgi:hypothetical protein